MTPPTGQTVKRATYPAYKPTGVEWLGNMPQHWATARLRFHVKVNPSRSELNGCPEALEVSFVPMEAVCEYGGLRLNQTRPLADVATGYTYFRDGDVLSAKITPCFENGKGSVAGGLVNGLGLGTTELHVLRPTGDLEQRYLFYVTISHAFRKLGTACMYGAGGQKRVPEDFVKDFRQPIPPIDEQRVIAAFLDRETGRIDALIEKKKRQIELLQEKRTALISRAVTKGLNPSAPLKDSGVEWLGEVPAHWQMKRLKHVVKCLDAKRIPLNSEERGEMQGDYPYWGANGIVDHVDDWLFDEDLVLLGEDGAPFFDPLKDVAFYVTGKIWVNNHAHVLRPAQGIDPRFLTGVLNSVCYAAYIEGTTRDKLVQEHMREIPVQTPSLEEQQAIAEFLDRDTAKIDGLVGKVRDSIDQLREYRTALISAAVTGKIDVREQPAVTKPVRRAPASFQRAVLAAEIVHRLHGQPTFGRVKFQKILYLCECHLGMDLKGNFRRQVAGPLDNRMMHSVESQMKRQKWYEARMADSRTVYEALENAGGYQKYFDRYWKAYRPALNALLRLVRRATTEQCEIVATLFAAWNDLVLEGAEFSDDDILREVRTNWHESKARFDESRLRTALQWMRDKGLVPQGRGKTTRGEEK